jgi:hypothetical protein
MIHHMSFGVRDPKHVAHVLAELMDATAVRAPTPPFPYGAHLVCLGDHSGAFLELLPATASFDPDAPLGMRQRPAPAGFGSAHVLVSSSLTKDEIEAIAKREGWRVQEVETGLFKIVKLWVENGFLVELLARGEAGRYVDTFGSKGMPTLDAKLRKLEADLDQALASMPRAVVEEALGRPDTAGRTAAE